MIILCSFYLENFSYCLDDIQKRNYTKSKYLMEVLMEKGKLNVNFWVYTLIALILSIVGYLWINCIFFVFILLYEKNDYLTKQVLQPFIIVVCQYLITLAVSFLSGIIFFAVPDSVTAVLSLILILGVGIIFFAFKVIGIVQVATKKEVQIPIFSSLANTIYDKCYSKQ